MPDNSFDLVSKIEMPEVSNAVQQALKEVEQRFDLKGSHSKIELNEKDLKIVLTSQDEFKLKAVNDILTGKLVKRKVPLKGLVYGEITPAASSTVKQEITLQQGIPIEKARDIVKKIKDSKLKVQASISGDYIRVSGRDRDTLQQAIALLNGSDFGIDMQFTNFFQRGATASGALFSTQWQRTTQQAIRLKEARQDEARSCSPGKFAY
jgi:cyclic-di-GMP-binding protein